MLYGVLKIWTEPERIVLDGVRRSRIENNVDLPHPVRPFKAVRDDGKREREKFLISGGKDELERREKVRSVIFKIGISEELVL